MSTLDMILTLTVVATMAIMALVGLWTARKRSWKLGLVRIGVTVTVAVISLPLARTGAALATDFVYGLIEPRLGPDVRAFLGAAPVGVEGVRVMAAMVAAPVLFLLIFAILRVIGSVVLAILGWVVPLFRRRDGRPAAFALGAANGAIVAVVTLIPLCGFLMLGMQSLSTVVDTGMVDSDFMQENVLDTLGLSGLTGDDVTALVDKVESNAAVSVIYGTVGKPAFRYLTSAQLDTVAVEAEAKDDSTLARPAGVVPVAVPDVSGRPTVVFLSEVSEQPEGEIIEMDLTQEICSLLRTSGCVVQAIDCINAESFTEADKEILFAAADSIFDSDSRWVELLAGDTLVLFSESWLENEAFLGLERPELDDTLSPMLDCILDMFANETPENLSTDIHTVMDVVGDLLVYDVFEPGVDPAEMVRRLGENGLLATVLEKLRANPRLEVLANEMQSVGMRMVTKMLDLDKLKSGEHDELLARVAEECNKVLHLDPEERRETAAREVAKAMREHDFEVSEAVAMELADKLIADLGDDNEVTVDELRTYLIDVAEGRVDLPDDIVTDAVNPGEL